MNFRFIRSCLERRHTYWHTFTHLLITINYIVKIWRYSASHVKISQLVNKMCSQQACSKPVNKLYQCCYFIKLLQGCHLQLVGKLLNCRTMTSCWNNLEQVCWAQQPCSKLSTSWEQAVRTHRVDKLLEQHWYKSATSLLQVERFYVRSTRVQISLLNHT
jgi:hypothetical protein